MEYENNGIFKSLTEREKRFWRNFHSTKSGNQLADMMNFQQDLKAYGYEHQRELEVLAEAYF